jgi:hypothetical protein
MRRVTLMLAAMAVNGDAICRCGLCGHYRGYQLTTGPDRPGPGYTLKGA